MLAINASEMASQQPLPEAQETDDDIKSKLVIFFRLCDSDKNGRVTWNEFHGYRNKYSYKLDGQISANGVKQDKETFMWLANGQESNDHKGYFTWDDVRTRFMSDL